MDLGDGEADGQGVWPVSDETANYMFFFVFCFVDCTKVTSTTPLQAHPTLLPIQMGCEGLSHN
jgi:hypothetical protein